MVILSMGSNLGDRAKHLSRGIQALSAAGFLFEKISSMYETPPWGKTDQPAFYNLAAAGTFAGSPRELLDVIHRTEKALGRERTEKWGPRVLDIDIIDFNGISFQDAELQLPHPHFTDRAFVLLPLTEILPDYYIESFGMYAADRLKALDCSSIHKKESSDFSAL